jgi:hypothetical protein
MKRLNEILFIAVLGFFMSCGEDTVVPVLDEGWGLWESKLYAEAHAKFVEAGGAEGLNGLGWTTLKMDSLDRAEIYFALSVSDGDGDTLTDAAAGLAITAWQQGDHQISLDAANYILRTQPEYIFSHDPSITEDDIILAKAYDEYHLLQYANCIASIQLLDATFNHTAGEAGIAQTLLDKLDELSGL